ncbi:hypothetical protein BZA05DRAFT_392648 [Tricharina praecox]|uniref:uncharacterized protein n=1 Tax=Tricharina praecox TaxID=43433 RepID=UPI00221F17E1|nr:uncharacterized protein BZA05DRAFT_392648 [Tricharina praecox]KAI5854813.1 hypothetical protein BZA05DRAFT_392648 [Tricharina praecox]
MASQNVEKTRLRLQRRIEEGQYYEAHQQLRVVSQRYLKVGNYDAAIEILTAGAQSLLKADQGGSGGDLCLVLVEVYKTAKLAPDSASKSRLVELITMMPAEEPSRKRFINETIAWTSKFGEFPAGDPELHHFIGNLYANEDEVYEAEKHLILGTRESAEVLARLLYEWYKQDEAHTAPTYIARAVFGYLLVGNLREACRSLEVFVGQLMQENSTLVIQEVQSASADIRIFPSLPLLNFLSLLTLATQTGGAEVFRNLKSHYASQLKDIQDWDDAIEHIGEMYFGIQIRRPTNILDMMGSMFGAGGAPDARSQAPQITGSFDLD